MTFFSEKKETNEKKQSKSMTHFFFYSVAFSFLPQLNTLHVVTNYVAESTRGQQQNLDESSRCKHLDADKHTPLDWLGREIWLEWTASVRHGANQLCYDALSVSHQEVCACVCVHVTPSHTWVNPWQCPGCVTLISVSGVVASRASNAAAQNVGYPKKRGILFLFFALVTFL